MFLHVFVILYLGGLHPEGSASGGGAVLIQVGVCIWGRVCIQGAGQITHPHWILCDMVNGRPVGILLECILVVSVRSHCHRIRICQHSVADSGFPRQWQLEELWLGRQLQI